MMPDNERRADALMGLDPFEAAALRQRRAVLRQRVRHANRLVRRPWATSGSIRHRPVSST
jgi:hypothetical protein